MPKVGSCKICERADRGAIEKVLQSDMPLRTIADQYGVSKTSLIRHKAHMQQRLPVAPAATERQGYDPQLARKARELEAEITNALLHGRVVDWRWALQDIARILVGLTEATKPSSE